MAAIALARTTVTFVNLTRFASLSVCGSRRPGSLLVVAPSSLGRCASWFPSVGLASARCSRSRSLTDVRTPTRFGPRVSPFGPRRATPMSRSARRVRPSRRLSQLAARVGLSRHCRPWGSRSFLHHPLGEPSPAAVHSPSRTSLRSLPLDQSRTASLPPLPSCRFNSRLSRNGLVSEAPCRGPLVRAGMNSGTTRPALSSFEEPGVSPGGQSEPPPPSRGMSGS